MNTEAIKCPACNASLQINDNSELVTCNYCGTTIHLTWRKPNNDNGIIVDSISKRTIGTIKMPPQYTLTGEIHPEIVNHVFPIGVNVTAVDSKGNLMFSQIGDAYQDISNCSMMKRYENTALTQISHTHYQKFSYLETYIDNYMSNFARGVNASSIVYVKNNPLPIRDLSTIENSFISYKQKTEREVQESMLVMPCKVLDYYFKSLCRVYDITVNGNIFRAAMSATSIASKIQIGLLGALGDLGGLIGAFAKKKQAQTNQNEFAYIPNGSYIDCIVSGISVLYTPKENFETEFNNAFTDFCSTMKTDQGLLNLMQQTSAQIKQNIQNYTQQQVNQMNQQFAAQQQAQRTREAAFDSYNKAWWDRTQASDATRRSSYQSQMAAQDRMSDNFSEAIRGVNTYVRPDGSEVEVSVAYDHAYSNYSNDTYATNSSFEPGGNWQEMQRKK